MPSYGAEIKAQIVILARLWNSELKLVWNRA